MIDVIRMHARQLMQWAQQILIAPVQARPVPIRVRAHRSARR